MQFKRYTAALLAATLTLIYTYVPPEVQATPIAEQGASTVTSLKPGTAADEAGKAEDAAHTSGDMTIPTSCVLKAGATANAGAAGDYANILCDSTSGAVYTQPVGSGAANLGKAEDAAHTTGDVGVAILGRVDATALTGSTSTDEDYGTLNLDTTGRLSVHDFPKASDGVSAFSYLDVDETADTPVTAAATLFSLHVSDQHATTDFWVKVYDKASAADENDTPVLRIFTRIENPRELVFPKGLAFSNGISVRCVTEVADSGTTGAGANECSVNATYK